MVKRMSAKEARNNFSDLLGLVYYSKEPVIVEKRGRAFAVVISPDDYETLLREREERFSVFDEIRAKNPEVGAEQTEEDAAREVASARQERSGKAKGSPSA